MINGAHAIIYSKNAEADREVLRDVLGLPHVDVGGGWLIFGLPPAEVAIHPSDTDDSHELYLMCPDIRKFIAGAARHGLSCSEVEDRGWGQLTQLTLPGGGEIGVYQPRHARPKSMTVSRKTRPAKSSKRPKPAARKKAKRKK